MRIIPAIDLIDGKCVRLTKGDYNTKIVYNENPVEVAKLLENAGLKYLHLVDLDGAKVGRVLNYGILEKIANSTSLKIDFGGGLRTDEDLQKVFDFGASQITVGSVAVTNKEFVLSWLGKYGAEKIILGADCKQRKISISGWAALSDMDILDFIKEYESYGVGKVISTDVLKDGMLEGPSLDLYSEIIEKTSVKLIASGGIRSVKDLEELKLIGCEGAIIGKALYEGRIKLEELKELC